MCLVSNGRVRTAKEDMVVYKFVYHNYEKDYFMAPYKCYEYFKGKINKTTIKKSEYKQDIIRHTTRKYKTWYNKLLSKVGYYQLYEQGFHFGLSPKNILEYCNCSSSTVHEFTIPKGSKYILGIGGLGVTECIIKN